MPGLSDGIPTAFRPKVAVRPDASSLLFALRAAAAVMHDERFSLAKLPTAQFALGVCITLVIKHVKFSGR